MPSTAIQKFKDVFSLSAFKNLLPNVELSYLELSQFFHVTLLKNLV